MHIICSNTHERDTVKPSNTRYGDRARVFFTPAALLRLPTFHHQAFKKNKINKPRKKSAPSRFHPSSLVSILSRLFHSYSFSPFQPFQTPKFSATDPPTVLDVFLTPALTTPRLLFLRCRSRPSLRQTPHHTRHRQIRTFRTRPLLTPGDKRWRLLEPQRHK